jgi:hypothetical protein
MTQGPGPLTRLPGNPDMDLIGSRIPEASADAVLSVTLYFNVSAAVFNMLVDDLFQNPGGNPFAVFSAG